MRIDIHYFSGTGNTAWVVRRLADTLLQVGDDVMARSCESEGELPDPRECDAVGIAFPTHASLVPPVFERFLDELPDGDGTLLFAITTAGYAAGDMAWHGARTLVDRGYEPFLYANVLMPNNLHLPVLSPLPVPKPKKIERIVEEAEETVRDLAAHVHTTTPRREGTGLFGRLFGISQRAFAGRFEERAFKGFEADETCTRCAWCVRHCPVDNIALTDDAVEFADRCVLCMRCYSFCPEDAIQSGDKTRDAEKYRRYKGPEGRPYRGR